MNNIMKYETIKAKAIAELRTQLEFHSDWPPDKLFMALLPAIEMRVNPRKLLAGWTEEAVKIIEGWDVRMVGKLVELFPGCIPKKWRGLPMRCEYGGGKDVEWIVIFGA